MSWQTVPICLECWHRREGDREPVRVKEPELELCQFCRAQTSAGIYTRANLGAVVIELGANEEPKLGVTGEFPEGKLDPSDQGELQFRVGHSLIDNLVRIEFGKPVAWLAMRKADALNFAKIIRDHAARLK